MLMLSAVVLCCCNELTLHLAVLPPPPMEEGKEEDHLGPLCVTKTGHEYLDVYAKGCVNEWSWQYNTMQDPFGEVSM